LITDQEVVKLGLLDKMLQGQSFIPLLVNLKCLQSWWEWIKNKRILVNKHKPKEEFLN